MCIFISLWVFALVSFITICRWISHPDLQVINTTPLIKCPAHPQKKQRKTHTHTHTHAHTHIQQTTMSTECGSPACKVCQHKCLCSSDMDPKLFTNDSWCYTYRIYICLHSTELQLSLNLLQLQYLVQLRWCKCNVPLSESTDTTLNLLLSRAGLSQGTKALLSYECAWGLSLWTVRQWVEKLYQRQPQILMEEIQGRLSMSSWAGLGWAELGWAWLVWAGQQ